MFPDYSIGERWADGAVHVVSTTAGLVALIVLLAVAIPEQPAAVLVSLCLYGFGLIATFGCSAGYNLVKRPRVKEILRKLDHAAIFVMIAGTYTPFALVAIGGAAGIALLSVVWSIAAFGVVVKLAFPRRFERMSVVLYLALGWTVLPAIQPLIESLSTRDLTLIFVGGVLYSGGTAFHLWRRLPYHNAIWHFLVLIAAACHYIAVWGALDLGA